MLQIEHVDATREAGREIAAVQGIDVLCLGPADLAVSLRTASRPINPIVQARSI